MYLKHRLNKLEQAANAPDKVDIAEILIAARDAQREAERTGVPLPPRQPCPPEWEHSRDPLSRAVYAARRRVGSLFG